MRNLLFSWATMLLLLSSACVSQVTQDLSGEQNLTSKKNYGTKWELITVQPDFIDRFEFLAISEIDGEILDKPLIFGIDIVLLPPGSHQLKLVLGQFENYSQLNQLDSAAGPSGSWQAELGFLELQEPQVPKPGKGRNYLVASYDKIYSSNSQSPEFMQRWQVLYPRTVAAGKNWHIETLDPQTVDLEQ